MSTDPLKITQAEAGTLVDALAGITSSESERLKAIEILTLGNLWSSTGGDTLQLTNFDKVAAKSKISSERLVELLPTRLLSVLGTELLRRADELDLQLPVLEDPIVLTRPHARKRPALAAKKFGPWFRRHLLDWILLLGLFSIGFLTLRASGVLSNYAPPFGLSENVIVTRRDLKAGSVLHVDRDVSSARLPLRSNYFTATNELEGLILSQDVSAQKPLRTENLLRLQLVATKDIPKGETIAKDAVALAWSTYHAKALLSPASAVDHEARLAVPKDNVISMEDVVP